MIKQTRRILLILIIATGNFVLVSLILQNKIAHVFSPMPVFFEIQRTIPELEKLLGHPEPIAKAVFLEDNLEITLRGFRQFGSKEIVTILQEELHPSESLGLYSINYLVQLVKNQGSLISSNQLMVIEYLLKTTLAHIEKWSLIPDRMKYNDHVVSARLESLILLKAFFKEQDNLSTHLEKIIDKHITYCVLELLDNKKFTWRTNHGLMQLRALLAFDYAIKENDLSEKVRKVIKDRLSEGLLLNFHLAEDGSVFEAASGYWRYVFSQWKIIASYPLLQSDTLLKNRLLKTETFLHAVSTSNGFVQGFGDSYNFFHQNYHRPINFPKDYIYRFGNGVAGINHAYTPYPLHIFFTASDNPPHVKKHPEDLSFYLFYSQPYFANAGTFAWDNSSERKFVLSQEAQNTLYNPVFPTPDSSVISDLLVKGDSLIVLKGEKWYGNQRLMRIIHFEIKKGKITLIDIGRNFTTAFNIHPEITVLKNHEKEYILEGENTRAILSANAPISLESGKISDYYNSLTQVERLQINNLNDTIRVSITLENYTSSEGLAQILIDSKKSQNRIHSAELLGKKYWKSVYFINPTAKRLIVPRLGLLFFISLILIVFRKLPVLNTCVVLLYLSICLIDILFSGVLLSFTFL